MQAEIADTLKKSQYSKKELFQEGAIASNFQTKLEEFNISKKPWPRNIFNRQTKFNYQTLIKINQQQSYIFPFIVVYLF